MTIINPYLNFNGNAEEAFLFYKSIFGGEFAMLQRMKDVPLAPGAPAISETDKEKIMHIALPIGGNILMASDVFEAYGHTFTAGNNFSVSVSADSKAEADRVFGALAAGGKIEMPIQDAFWGSYFGMCADKFGIQWMVSFDAKYVNK